MLNMSPSLYVIDYPIKSWFIIKYRNILKHGEILKVEVVGEKIETISLILNFGRTFIIVIYCNSC